MSGMTILNKAQKRLGLEDSRGPIVFFDVVPVSALTESTWNQAPNKLLFYKKKKVKILA